MKLCLSIIRKLVTFHFVKEFVAILILTSESLLLRLSIIYILSSHLSMSLLLFKELLLQIGLVPMLILALFHLQLTILLPYLLMSC